MKKNTWVWVAGAALVAWWLWKNKKTGSGAASAKNAAEAAKQIVSNAVDQTTFLPDTTTDKDLYAQDQNACR